MIILTGIGLMIFFLLIGAPVGFALGLSGVIGLYLVGGVDAVCGVMNTVPYRTAASYTLTTVPMFILMAELISESGVVKELFSAAQKWLDRLPGGLAIASVFASAGMAAMSGSSTASAAALASISIPEMIRHGYKTYVAAGVITVAGTLAIMIPPSIPFVIYGAVTENSIGKLLIAGVIPGLMTASVYTVGIIIWSKVCPNDMPRSSSKYSWRERWQSIRDLWAFAILASMVLVSMYLGLATPTEAAAVGAFGALVIPLLRRQIALQGIRKAIHKTIEVTTMIFMIIIGAMIFGYFLTITQAAQGLISYIGGLHTSRTMVLCLLVVMYLILGCFLDVIAILLITLPLVYPLVISLGYDAIWFGVIIVKLIEIALITPPLGMNAYVVSASSKIPLEYVFRGTIVMLLFEGVTLGVLLYFPSISTWLPSMMLTGIK